jgi:hypothetical protein
MWVRAQRHDVLESVDIVAVQFRWGHASKAFYNLPDCPFPVNLQSVKTGASS